MARRAWESLSSDYRARLVRNGITKGQYESGANLKAARGHRTTPEHPRDVVKHPERYREYVQRAASLQRQVYERKLRIFGDRIKYNDEHSRRYVFTGDQDIPVPGTTQLRRALEMTDDEFEEAVGFYEDSDWSFLWYH